MDASGSMGWNDRYGSRTVFVSKFIEHLQNYYPSSVLFDIIKFGSIVLNTEQVTSAIGINELGNRVSVQHAPL
jgi:hypothetical protein